MMKHSIIGMIVTGIVFMLLPTVIQAETPLKFFVGQSKEAYYSKWEKAIYTEALRRMGIEVQFVYCPLKRAELMADNGEIDGQSRAPGYGDAHPNLLKVEESVFSINFCAFTLDPQVQLNGWESLRDTSYQIEYRLGAEKVEHQLTALVPPNRFNAIPTFLLALKKLFIGRTDLVIGAEGEIWNVLQTEDMQKFLKESEMQDVKMYNSGVLESIPIYTYLYHTHQELVPKFSDVLNAMKAEGLIEQYRPVAP